VKQSSVAKATSSVVGEVKTNGNKNGNTAESTMAQSTVANGSAARSTSPIWAEALGTKEDILRDYRIGWESRHASLFGRREVLSGKAKFGIFGDGKELAQLAMARAFRKGDFRSGYYRDQTVMFALGISDVQKFYAQLYAHTDVEHEPSSAGRSMNGHFGTRLLNADGTWRNQTQEYNSSADVSPTASQMPRLVGLAYASRLYREISELQSLTDFSKGGQEIAWGTIGNASAAEGMFWEAVDAIGVLKAPAVISIWDDGYGISVPNDIQHTKANVGELLKGFARTEDSTTGYDIYTVKGWDYEQLVTTYIKAAETVRSSGHPAIIHVTEVTQPQGHSTSGSHERYKSKERLQWESEYDGLLKLREWIIKNGVATEQECDAIEKSAMEYVSHAKRNAWEAYTQPIKNEVLEVAGLINAMATELPQKSEHLSSIARELTSIREPFRVDIFKAVFKVLTVTASLSSPSRTQLIVWRNKHNELNKERYSSHLYSESNESVANVPQKQIIYADDAPKVNGSEIMNRCFEENMTRDPRIIAFGEDVGQLGDVNQGFIGLQEKFGVLRVSDTGIREATIIGQAIGMAMRGLRPIAEMQYLDYVLYGLQLMSDDLATVQWRTKGGQKAPAIIRTRGHRLEGVWHAGSPMAGIINLVRGMYVCVPRNMTQAAGMYNTLLRSDEPAIVVEVLNGYRLKEVMPSNAGEFTVPLGIPEVLRQGTDITIVTYGPLCRIATDASALLEELGVSAEVIDVQTLLPFDTTGVIVQSLKKTNRVLFLDEDVPGGTTAFMMQEVLEKQGGYSYLDSAPKTLTANEHRTAYGSDGNYWTKPESEHIIESVMTIMHETNPVKYPLFWK
jgi:2-oxoisovalerate dehydrogenase E1 component